MRPENQPPVFSARYNFEVIVSGCSWIISYEDTSASTNADLVDVRATASGDGTNIYFVQYQSESGIKKSWGDRYDSVKEQLPAAIAKIFPGNYPPPEEDTLQKLWLAFAANCVLTSPSGKLKPVESVDLAIFYDNTNFSRGYYFTIDKDGPGTRQITLTNDGYFIVRDKSDGEVHRIKYSPPYDTGFVEGVGIWRDGAQKIGGVFATKEFKFSAFAPKFGKKTSSEQISPEFIISYSYACTVTNIDTVDMEQVPAKLPAGRILVTDRRFEDQGWSKLDYITTNGWIAVEDKFLALRAQNSQKSSFESEALSVLNLPSKQGKWFRYVIWAFLALPLALWVRKGIADKLKHKQ